MKLDDIKCLATDSNSHPVYFEGKVAPIFVTSSSREHAVKQMMKTGYYVNSIREIDWERTLHQ